MVVSFVISDNLNDYPELIRELGAAVLLLVGFLILVNSMNSGI